MVQIIQLSLVLLTLFFSLTGFSMRLNCKIMNNVSLIIKESTNFQPNCEILKDLRDGCNIFKWRHHKKMLSSAKDFLRGCFFLEEHLKDYNSTKSKLICTICTIYRAFLLEKCEFYLTEWMSLVLPWKINNFVRHLMLSFFCLQAKPIVSMIQVIWPTEISSGNWSGFKKSSR